MHAHEGINVVGHRIAETCFHFVPANAQLFSADHRQRRFNALAHVHAVAKHGGHAIFVNGHECAGALGGLLAGGHLRCVLRAHLLRREWHEGQAHCAAHRHRDEAAT